MRVIKDGQVPVIETKKTCKTCKTRFAYTPSDTKEDRDGRYVVCPTCKTFIAV